MTEQQHNPLTPEEMARDALGSFHEAVAALRERHRDGWRPAEGSPFRPREGVAE